ncbi:putative uncharacterized protein [Clostridium sp. CAG:921]|nr:putative uncharacterized protein [Clostridium sp. CAG:921]
MGINIDFKRDKVESTYKTIYIKNELVEKINDLAKKNNTSFNNVVIKMIEYCTTKGKNF